MKLKILIFSAVFMLAIFSCENNNEEYGCEAVVIDNMENEFTNCTEKVFSLKFTKGIDLVQDAVGEGNQINDSVCLAVNLPALLKISGLKIQLDIRALESDEHFTCYNMEMPLAIGPAIFVTRAERK